MCRKRGSLKHMGGPPRQRVFEVPPASCCCWGQTTHNDPLPAVDSMLVGYVMKTQTFEAYEWLGMSG